VTFTDDDLKRLKDEVNDPYWYPSDLSVQINALLARLKAAERYATKMRKGREGWFNPEYRIWQEAAGK
jgi:hypothetical protein